MEQPKMLIDGKWVLAKSGKTFPTFNPATGEEIAQIPLAGPEEVDMAAMAARRAYKIWSRKTQTERSAIVFKLAAAYRQHAAEIAKLEVLEHGTPSAEAPGLPMAAAAMSEYAASASRTLMGNSINAVPHSLIQLQREPMGVCGIITPWNHAFIMIAVKAAAVLATGNTCVIKPPSVNSLIALKLAEIIDSIEDIPKGAVNVITGPGGSVGTAIASHPEIDIIGFTGSSETGKAIMAAGSSTLKRYVLECGGNNPVIICEDADLDAAVEYHAMWQYHNAGMHCSDAGRYYVHEKVYDKFVEKFLAKSKTYSPGDPADKNTFLGPLASREHRDRVEAYIKSGIDEGAKLLLGGHKPAAPFDKGFYVVPTVFSEVKQHMKIARDEIFGPVAVIMDKYSTDEEVIELANDTRYGLCAVVWTEDMRKGIKFTQEIHAGAVFVNNQIQTPETTWGGFKESGIGIEGSVVGLEQYTQLKMIVLKYKK
jgi:acyl-CoA reductase-like NAD-dependent aldehyde dehydrogenase